jgi:hypothetical protein
MGYDSVVDMAGQDFSKLKILDIKRGQDQEKQIYKINEIGLRSPNNFSNGILRETNFEFDRHPGNINKKNLKFDTFF